MSERLLVGGGVARVWPRPLTSLLLLVQIESGTMWKQVYVDLGIPVLNSAASYNVKTAYKK